MDYFSEEYQDVWALSPYPTSFFSMLGFTTSSYAGTFNSKQAIIQTFFYNENDMLAKQKVANYTNLCSSFFKETNIKDDVMISTEAQSEHYKQTTFVSNNICNYLTSVSYTSEIELFMPLFNQATSIYSLAIKQRIEFLIGAYLNHSKAEAMMIFNNNYDKMALVHRFMAELAEEEDEIQLISKFMSPHKHSITINADGNLWAMLKRIMISKQYQL